MVVRREIQSAFDYIGCDIPHTSPGGKCMRAQQQGGVVRADTKLRKNHPGRLVHFASR